MNTNQVKFNKFVIERFNRYSYCLNNNDLFDAELTIMKMTEFEITVTQFLDDGCYSTNHIMPTYLITLTEKEFTTHLLELLNKKETTF